MSSPMQPHGRGPGEIVSADGPTGFRTVILIEAGHPGELARVATNALAPLGVSGLGEPGTDHEIHDEPDRAAPVADRIESGVVRVETRNEKADAARDTLEMFEQAAISRFVPKAGIERQKRCTRDEAGRCAAHHVPRAVGAHLLVPQPSEAALCS